MRMNTMLAITGVALTAGLLSACSDRASDAKLTELAAQVAELKQQAQAANDYVAVANLQASYGYYVDKSRWDDAADLFAKDATLEIAGRGVFKGQERVRAYLKQLGDLKYGTLYNHMQLQPVIHIAPDGKTAKARWRSLMQVGHLGQEARWGEATYENEYVKDAGTWKISKLHSFITFYVDFDKGWNKGAVPMLGKIPGLQPDEPPSVEYKSFPDVFVPPYHYPNPVTGK
jgi:outer membrane murein-binding lipoprotein Lpp